MIKIIQKKKTEFNKFRNQEIYCNGCGTRIYYNQGKAINQDGTIRASYFSHQTIDGCTWSRESDVHLWAKIAIKEIGVINNRGFYYKGYYQESLSIPVKDAELEKRGGGVGGRDFTPDVYCKIESEIYWIEVVYTHSCEDDKIKFIVENGINCIEVIIELECDRPTTRLDVFNGIKNGIYDFEVINHNKLNIEVGIKEKDCIRDILIELKKQSKGVKQKTFFSTLNNATERINSSKDTLNSEDYKSAISFVDRLRSEKINSILGFYLKLNSIESALQTIQVIVQRHCTEEQKEAAIHFINKKLFLECPIIETGIYNGYKVDMLPSSYIYFIRDVSPKQISSKVINYLQGTGIKSKYVAEFVYEMVEEKKKSTKLFSIDDFQHNKISIPE